MENEAAAWLVKWVEGGINCRRTFVSQDEALKWAVDLTRPEKASDIAVVPLYERASDQEGEGL